MGGCPRQIPAQVRESGYAGRAQVPRQAWTSPWKTPDFEAIPTECVSRDPEAMELHHDATCFGGGWTARVAHRANRSWRHSYSEWHRAEGASVNMGRRTVVIWRKLCNSRPSCTILLGEICSVDHQMAFVDLVSGRRANDLTGNSLKLFRNCTNYSSILIMFLPAVLKRALNSSSIPVTLASSSS